MKTLSSLLIILGFMAIAGCSKHDETSLNGRYEIHALTWESTIESARYTGSITHHDLVKIDTQTGRVWIWCDIMATNGISRWNELTDYDRNNFPPKNNTTTIQ